MNASFHIGIYVCAMCRVHRMLPCKHASSVRSHNAENLFIFQLSLRFVRSQHNTTQHNKLLHDIQLVETMQRFFNAIYKRISKCIASAMASRSTFCNEFIKYVIYMKSPFLWLTLNAGFVAVSLA